MPLTKEMIKKRIGKQKNSNKNNQHPSVLWGQYVQLYELENGRTVWSNVKVLQEKKLVGKVIKRVARHDRNRYLKNENKLRSFAELKDKWFGENSKAFSRDLLNNTNILLKKLVIQPELFPTPDGRIQMEFDTKPGYYIEIVIGEKESEVLVLDGKRIILEGTMEPTAKVINQLVKVYG